MTAIEHEISDDEYEQMLNDIYPEDVSVCGYKHSQGTLLKEIDPIAFQCGKSDEMKWECSECGNVYDEEDEAEECWKTCQDVVECNHCGETILEEKAFHNTDTGEFFCSMHCDNLAQLSSD